MEDNKQVAVVAERAAMVPMVFNEEQTALIKRTVAKGTTNDELALFLYTCKRTGLDPLLHQIHCVKRGDKITIQTGIDGYRLNAERTGKYAPGREPSFVEKDGKVISATAYIKKLIAGEWHEVAATAHFDEYAQVFNGKLGNMWQKMPHAMIAKCAEALALRKAFPAEMAGVYTDEEMAQADNTARETTADPMPQRKSATPTEPPAEEEKPKSTPKPERASDTTYKAKGKVTKFIPATGNRPAGMTIGDNPLMLKTFTEDTAEALARHHKNGTEVELDYKMQKSKNPKFPDNAMIVDGSIVAHQEAVTAEPEEDGPPF
jgi:phage recombination protein Bet